MRTALLLLFLLGSTSVSEAAMSDQTLTGDIFDNRITRCGVRIDTAGMAMLRPFIETSDAISGTFDLSVSKRSASGSSTSVQSSRFAGGALPDTRMAVDRPAEIAVKLDVSDAAGAVLCRLDTNLSL